MMQPIHQIGHLSSHHVHHCDSEKHKNEVSITHNNHCDVCDFQFAKPFEHKFESFEFILKSNDFQAKIIGEITSKISSQFSSSYYLRGPPKIA